MIVDWRSDPESWEGGPPARLRFHKSEVADSLRSYFRKVTSENIGRFMFGVVGSDKISTEP